MSIAPQTFNQSSFGELMCAEVSGVIQLQFVYNLNPELVVPSVTSSGTVISSPPFALLSVPASPSASAAFQSLNTLHYKPGLGASATFTSLFTSGVANSRQYVGLGNSFNGFFFGWNGSTFGILYRNNSVDSWIYQVSWNQDPLNGSGSSGVTLDPTKGNVYKIQYQWLGFGNINFFIENGGSGAWILVHQIQYPNQSVSTSLTNAALPLMARVESSGAASLVQLRVPCMAAMVEGLIFNDDVRYSVLGMRGITANTTTLVLSVRNNVNYAGFLNYKSMHPDFTSMGNTGSNNVIYTYILNPTVTASFSPVNTSTGYSIASFAVGGTISAGRTVLTQYVGANSYDNVFIESLNLVLNPGDILSITALSSSTATVSASLSWVEQF